MKGLSLERSFGTLPAWNGSRWSEVESYSVPDLKEVSSTEPWTLCKRLSVVRYLPSVQEVGHSFMGSRVNIDSTLNPRDLRPKSRQWSMDTLYSFRKSMTGTKRVGFRLIKRDNRLYLKLTVILMKVSFDIRLRSTHYCSYVEKRVGSVSVPSRRGWQGSSGLGPTSSIARLPLSLLSISTL